jgi:hypothetical protein
VIVIGKDLVPVDLLELVFWEDNLKEAEEAECY